MATNPSQIPENLETSVGESVSGRTSSLAGLRDLGIPDLVHLTKVSPAKSGKESGTYHFVTGLELSLSANAAAYLTSLTFPLGETQLWFGQKPGWKVKAGILCSYNAFSKVDVRVMVQIPGSAESYVVDQHGDKRPATDELWLECYMSAMVRALVWVDDDVYYVNGCRRFNSLATKESCTTFLDAFEKLFAKGPLLGSNSETQTSTLVRNNLVDAFFNFLDITKLYEAAIVMLERLAQSEPAASNLLVRALFLGNQETRAVRLLSQLLTNKPRDADLLDLQAQFCLRKGSLDLALDCATRAIKAASSEFWSWYRLVEVYTELENYEQALVTLNSAAIVSKPELDYHRLPRPAKVHLPLPNDGVLDEVWSVSEDNSTNTKIDPELLKLPAPNLRGTLAKAYELLTTIVSRIGWAALLVHRSKVFVMAEEYQSDDEQRADDELVKKTDDLKPEAAAKHVARDSAVAKDDSAKNKRLCERWLDNMFMVLYSDLRVHTVWRAEYVHYQSQQLPYERLALEWEILGMTASRLKYTDEARDAFQHALDLKFSHRVLWKLLDYQLADLCKPSSSLSEILYTITCLRAWNHRWYMDFSPKLLICLRKLVEMHGLVKVRSQLWAEYASQSVFQLLEADLNTIQKLIGDQAV